MLHHEVVALLAGVVAHLHVHGLPAAYKLLEAGAEVPDHRAGPDHETADHAQLPDHLVAVKRGPGGDPQRRGITAGFGLRLVAHRRSLPALMGVRASRQTDRHGILQMAV